MLGSACGPERLSLIERTSLDDLFPQLDKGDARAAGCGVLFNADGGISRGKGVTWDQ
jgi:hypothetical protein